MKDLEGMPLSDEDEGPGRDATVRGRRRTWKRCHCQRKMKDLEGMPLSEEDKGPGGDTTVRGR